MKKNKLLVVLLVIVCVLSVSVGFAVVSQNLEINGTATSGDETALGENFKVVFNNGSYNKTASNDTTGDITGTVTGTTTTATITCSGMTKKGEYAVFNVVVKNNSTEYGAKLIDFVITNTGENNEYYEITYNWDGSTIAPNGTATMTVKIEMLITPNTQRAASFTIDLVAEAVEVK